MLYDLGTAQEFFQEECRWPESPDSKRQKTSESLRHRMVRCRETRAVFISGEKPSKASSSTEAGVRFRGEVTIIHDSKRDQFIFFSRWRPGRPGEPVFSDSSPPVLF